MAVVKSARAVTPISIRTSRRFSIRSPSGTIKNRPIPNPACVQATMRPVAEEEKPREVAINSAIGCE